MAKCKNCDEQIKWERDEYDERWIPTDPDTGDRHSCRVYDEEESEREATTTTPRCKYCDKEISFKQIVINHGASDSGNNNDDDSGDLKWIPHEPDGSRPHNCQERKQAWMAEQSQRTGRSEAQLCRNGCGALVFWNYDVRSKINKKPLPYEQATNAYHTCPKYKPKQR
jgi:hypothetical protein